MENSLLWLSKNQAYASIGQNTIYHLSLDRIFSNFGENSFETSYFLKILSHPSVSADEIIFRQTIFADFIKNIDFFYQLKDLFLKLDQIVPEYETTHREVTRYHNSNISLETATNLVRMSALALKRSLFFLISADELFADVSITSSGLCGLQELIHNTVNNTDFKELLELCSKFERYSSIEAHDFQITIDCNGKIEYCQLTAHKDIKFTDKNSHKNSLFNLKKRAIVNHGNQYSHNLLNFQGSSTEKLAIKSISDIALLLDSITSSIINVYHPISNELIFYSIGLKYYAYITENGYPITMPLVGNQLVCENMYDLFLLTLSPKYEVIPNDVISSEHRGTVIFGENRSGKTVFLRALAIVQILAQAGLPVPCASAKFEIKKSIFTVFAESENSNNHNSGAGRFEQEVIALKCVFEHLKSPALILMNETFQTTSYDEGAKCISDILKYLCLIDSEWFLVSHMHQIKRYFENDEILFLKSNTNYKIFNNISQN